jgi:salicylate biosynthesis isochorismate synthase/menaquinone-specific isochorismate synthase
VTASPAVRAASEALEAIQDGIGQALERDRRTLVSATVEVADLDPAALGFASRLASDRWFCWEQPERDGFALAGIGTAWDAVSRGEARFGDVERACAELARDRVAEEPPGLPAGAGPVWTGGFAFAPDGGRAPQWSSLPPALAVLPELALCRVEGSCYLTLAEVVAPDDSPQALGARLRSRVGSLREEPLPLLDPHPAGEASIRSARPPHDFERAVERATELISGGELEKVVLAREVVVEAPAAHDPAAVYGALRDLFPTCFCFCVGTPEAAFLGASPELLVRRSGAVAATAAVAGSTRRSADPAVDDHLGEQLVRSEKDRHEHEIVVRRIERALRPHAVWVEAAPDPELVRVANIQHLATPVHAQLSDPRSAIDLAGRLHPTPALGGEPRDAALAAIPELERMDRGWYAGPIGWMDAAEDGELCVGIRSALIRDRTAHLYAGGGIVAGSDPAAELAETEVKLEALLPLLAG